MAVSEAIGYLGGYLGILALILPFSLLVFLLYVVVRLAFDTVRARNEDRAKEVPDAGAGERDRLDEGAYPPGEGTKGGRKAA